MSSNICIQKCDCKNHQLFTDEGKVPFTFRTRAYFAPNGTRRGEFSELLRRQLVKESTLTICTVCLAYGKRKIEEQRQKEISKRAKRNATEDTELVEVQNDKDDENESLTVLIGRVNLCLQGLEWGTLANQERESLCSLAENLGKVINKSLYDERTEMAAQCSSLETLMTVEPKKWYAERNQLLASFISGSTGVSLQTCSTNTKKMGAAIHCVEQFIYTRNINTVTPFAYMRNILTYIISKSKMACDITGTAESSGCYTKVNSLLNVPSESLMIQDKSDVTVTFDNEQKVGRHSGRIRERSKQALSIITTVRVLEVNP